MKTLFSNIHCSDEYFYRVSFNALLQARRYRITRTAGQTDGRTDGQRMAGCADGRPEDIILYIPTIAG